MLSIVVMSIYDPVTGITSVDTLEGDNPMDRALSLSGHIPLEFPGVECRLEGNQSAHDEYRKGLEQ